MANIGYLQLVRHCNQYCRFCSNPATGWMLDLDTAKRAVDDFAERIARSLTRSYPDNIASFLDPGSYVDLVETIMVM